MGKKILPQDRIIDFFMTTPVVECVPVFNTIKRVLFNRQYGTVAPSAVAPKPVVKRKRRTRAEIEASKKIDEGLKAVTQ